MLTVKEMAMPKLTKTVVENEQPSAGQRFVWDSELTGFGVKIFPTGVKSFIFQYRTPEGNTKRLTIGKMSDTLTVDQARKIATEHLREVLNGKDPQGEKKARKHAPTLSEVIAAYLLSDTFKEKAESTRVSDMGRINRHPLPLVGKLYADKLTTNDVKKAIKAINDGETHGTSQ